MPLRGSVKRLMVKEKKKKKKKRSRRKTAMALKTSDLSRGRLSLGLSLCARLPEVHVADFVFLFAFGLFLLGCLVFGVCLHCLPAAVFFFFFFFLGGGGSFLFFPLFIYGAGIYYLQYSTLLSYAL